MQDIPQLPFSQHHSGNSAHRLSFHSDVSFKKLTKKAITKFIELNVKLNSKFWNQWWSQMIFWNVNINSRLDSITKVNCENNKVCRPIQFTTDSGVS